MNRIVCWIVFVLLLPCAHLRAQGNRTHDTARATDSVQLILLPQVSIFQDIHKTPSFKLFGPYGFDHGELQVLYQYDDRKELHLLRDGTSSRSYSLMSEGVKKIGNKLFWGEAGYRSYRIHNTAWSSTAKLDDVLGPYLIADSIGGDFSGEKYVVSGGFAGESGRWSYGAEAGYAAGQSCRKVDPRPKSTVTDIYFNAGVARQIGEKYRIGLSGEISSYKHNLEISVEQSHANYDFFVMRGFGLFHHQLSDKSSNFSWRYQGLGYEGGMMLAPSGNGFFARTTLKINNTDSDKGNNYKPFRYSLLKSESGIGWQSIEADTKFFGRADYSYQKGTGREKTYKYEMVNDVFGQYVLLSSSDMYYLENHKAVASVCVQTTTCRNDCYWAEAKVGYSVHNERYELPEYRMNFSRLLSSIQIGGLWSLREKSSLQAQVDVGYSPSLDSEKLVPEKNRLFDLSVRPDIAVFEAYQLRIAPKITYIENISKGIGLKIAVMGNCTFINKGSKLFSIGTNVGLIF